eukprot:505339-Hanusia_phi.AAC.2
MKKCMELVSESMTDNLSLAELTKLIQILLRGPLSFPPRVCCPPSSSPILSLPSSLTKGAQERGSMSISSIPRQERLLCTWPHERILRRLSSHTPQGGVELVIDLLSRGANLNWTDIHGATGRMLPVQLSPSPRNLCFHSDPVFSAMHLARNAEVAQLLINAKADVLTADKG